MSIDSPGEHIAPGYNLDDQEMHRLTAQLLAERPPAVDDRFICYRLEGDDPLSDIARNIERVVFEQAFKGNDAKKMTAEYEPYDSASTFFVTIDTVNKTPTGALRVISNSEKGFKSLNDLEEKQIITSPQEVCRHYNIEDQDKVWDIGTVGVLPEFRSAQGAISVQLYRAMYDTARGRDIEHFVSIVDTPRLEKLTGYLGIPFEKLMNTEPFSYLGSKKSQAVYGYVPEFYKKMNRKRYTIKGLLARKALQRLVKGSEDDALQFPKSGKL